MFLAWAKNHCRFIIVAFDGLHFFDLSELSGFLGSLFAVVSRVLVLLHFEVFQELTQLCVSFLNMFRFVVLRGLRVIMFFSISVLRVMSLFVFFWVPRVVARCTLMFFSDLLNYSLVCLNMFRCVVLRCLRITMFFSIAAWRACVGLICFNGMLCGAVRGLVFS